jgi:hypothetical protein
MVTAFGLLVLSALASACGLVAQTVGARRADRRGALDPGLLARLAGDPVYVAGFLAQCAGFVLAFLARGALPLYVVQAGSTAAVGIAALMGLALGWRLRARDLVALIALAGGLALLAGAAQPSVVEHVPDALGLTLLGTLAATVVLAVPAVRIPGGLGSVVTGALAGVAFAVVAVAARPVAAHPLLELWREPLAYLVVAAAVVGQGLLALALQRGATTPAAAAMDTATTLLAAVVGLTVLGDRIAPGRASWVAAGLALVVGAVLVLASAGSSERVPGPDAVPA